MKANLNHSSDFVIVYAACILMLLIVGLPLTIMNLVVNWIILVIVAMYSCEGVKTVDSDIQDNHPAVAPGE